jgi:dTDP-4-dehydrorhamnose 3,5-epimerase
MIVDPVEQQFEANRDERGLFRRISDMSGMQFNIVQTSISVNSNAFTLRGLHFQARPSQEWKIVSCLFGEIFDVLVDVRTESPNYGRHSYYVLNENNGKSLIVPPGFAHGFMTLRESTSVLYQIGALYEPKLARTIYWNDPKLGIEWPALPKKVSAKDQNGLSWPQEY